MQLPAAAPPPEAPAARPKGETRQCPHCGETVLAAARKCKHCKSMLLAPGPRFRGPKRRRRTKGEGRSAIVFGLMSIPLLVVPMIGLVLAGIAILYGNSARKNPEDRTQGIIGMCLGATCVLIVFGVLIALIIAGVVR
jgi:hypothetical protein